MIATSDPNHPSTAAAGPGSPRARRRSSVTKAEVRMTLAFVLVVLALFNGAGWFMYRRAMGLVEEDLGRHLVSIGRAVARGLDAEAVRALALRMGTAVDRDDVQASLESALDVYGLDNITLLSPEEAVLAGVGGGAFLGAQDLVLRSAQPLDLNAVLAGEAVHAPLHRVGGETFKSAFVPVTDSSGDVVGLLGLDASASFLESATVLRRLLLALSAASVVFAGAVALLFHRTVRTLVQAEEERRHREKLSALGTMAAGVAHEIRNPLGIIRGTAEILAEEEAAGGHRRGLLESIVSEVDRLDRLLSNFLAFARPARGAAGVTDLAATLRECLQQIEADFARSGVRVAAEIGDLPPVRGNAPETRQVFLNLLINAREAMPRGGTVRVTGRERRIARRGPRLPLGRDGGRGLPSGRFVEIAVSDEGEGIPPDLRDRILDPFFSTKAGGTGLGLSIVDGLVTSAGGYLDIESKRGRGTTVRVGFPASTP